MLLMPTDRLRLGPFFLLLTAIAGCRAQQSSDIATANDAQPSEPATNLTAAVPAPAGLDRAGLLNAVRSAADASATGVDDAQAQRKLDGRQFEVRVRFGCAGPQESLKTATLGWSFDERTRTLRLKVTPTISADQEEISALAPEGTEAVEGFWIPRPWILGTACPVDAAPKPAPPLEGASAQSERTPAVTAPDADQQDRQPAAVRGRIGIAEFFGEDDARTGRRGQRPYESTKVLDKDQMVGRQGFNLVLSGRLRALPGRKVIHCIVAGRDSPPNCVVSAHFDQVWIEHPDGGETIAQWSRN
jgi:hypothetical protein